jgi:hypothetical protein
MEPIAPALAQMLIPFARMCVGKIYGDVSVGPGGGIEARRYTSVP